MKLTAFIVPLLIATTVLGAEQPWRKIDEGFQFLVPPDWAQSKVQGIDSHVGVYRGTSAYLEFDEVFGLGYTNEKGEKVIDDLKRKEADTKLLKPGEEVWHVDGRIARFTFSKVDPKVFGQREYSNVASLFIPYDGRAGYLSVHLFYAGEDYLPTVRRILKSFTWPRKSPTRR